MVDPVKQVHGLFCRGINPQFLHRSVLLHPTYRAFATSTTSTPLKSINPTARGSESSKHPLSLLPFGVLIRSYLIAALSSSPLLLNSSLRLLSNLANTQSRLLSIDHNRLLRHLLKSTFYVHFCAGETPKEVENAVSSLKRIGYHGIILAYAKEVAGEGGGKLVSGYNDDKSAAVDVETWKRGNLATIKLVKEGDFVAVKFTGAGDQVVQDLSNGVLPGKLVENAMTEICELAKERRVGLLVDSEQNFVQAGIELWTLRFQARYNINSNDKSVVYGTYQAYLRSTPAKLAQHLGVAKKQGFVLGVKLVRGAYMGSDPRQIIWSSKEETDITYDGLVKALILKEYDKVLVPAKDCEDQGFPGISLVVATHNRASVQNALRTIRARIDRGKPPMSIAFGQLMGMADEVSGELILTAQANQRRETSIQVYKYLPWGTVSECLKYLVRRAHENKDAVHRANEGHAALRGELIRRIFGRRPLA